MIKKPLTVTDKQMRLLIIDGHAFAYRAFYAIRGLTSPTGQPTNAIYGFINMLAKLEAQVLPTIRGGHRQLGQGFSSTDQ